LLRCGDGNWRLSERLTDLESRIVLS
jgi:hypothetical protein